jgi:UDP-N-acetylglucosamine 4,6-dehydratase
VIFSRCEAKQAAMKAKFQDDRLRFFIGDVRDATRIMDACRGVDIVIHAAAAKRVEVAEENPSECVATNVIGTQNVARACIERGVLKAVLTSTDKAAAANTLYGASKLCAERLWLASNSYAAGTVTRLAGTRYGNVCGSTGSVIPIWKAQAKSGTITVTHSGMTRFFMSMDEAVELVMLALANMRGGDLFVPKLGQALIHDLARAVFPECAIRETGIRPGEKMHETLITEDEARSTYDAGKFYIVESEIRSWESTSPLPYPKVLPGFSYRSDTAPVLPIKRLLELAA